MPKSQHLLKIYRARCEMQLEGITNPLPIVKRLCNTLVEELARLPDDTEVEIVERPSGEFDFIANEKILATGPSDTELERLGLRRHPST